MTTATMALTELAEKGADSDLLREKMKYMAQQLMELQVQARCGAGYGEKNPMRLNSRNSGHGIHGWPPCWRPPCRTPTKSRSHRRQGMRRSGVASREGIMEVLPVQQSPVQHRPTRCAPARTETAGSV